MFNRTVARTLIFAGIFSAVSSRLSARQAEGDTIVVSEKIGKVVDLEERDRYDLFRAVSGFRSAVLLKKPDGGYVFEVVHSDTGANHDVTVQIISTKEKVQKLRESIDVTVNVKKAGKWLSIKMKDGTTVKGELLAVEDGRLFLKDSSASAAFEMEIDRVARITLPKETRFFRSIGRGFFIAGMSGMLIGFISGDDKPGFFGFTTSQKVIIGGLSLGILGAAAGAVYGLFTGIDESTDLTSVPPGRMSAIMKKMETWARYGKEIQPGCKSVLMPAPDTNPTLAVQKPPEDATGKPGRVFSKAMKPEKFSRFHFNYTPRYFRFHGLGEFNGLLQDIGFNDTPSYIGWFDSEPTEYPHKLKDPVIFFKDCSFDFSASRKFSLGISFESLGKHGVVGRRTVGDAETYLIGFFEGRSWFMTASYFPVPDAFVTKNTVKLTAGIGCGNVRMDFYGSENSYSYEDSNPGDFVDKIHLSKNTPAYILSLEWIHFFNDRWSLGLNAGYKWIPVKTDEIPVDCFYSAGWDDTAAQTRHEVLGIAIPARTWNFGGLGIGLHFGLHL